MKKGILFRCRKTAAVVMAFAMTLSYLPQQGISAYAKDGSVASQSQVTVSSRECSGWYESAYVEWQPVDGAKSYNVYIKGETEADSAYKKLDDELIRQYPDYWRADAPGLKAGKYMFKVEAVTDSTTASIVTSAVEVMSYDRSGYGFVNGTSSGAYNEDGTLKDNAVVLYITENTKDTVSLDVVTGSKGEVTSYTGLQAILYGFKKGKDSRPLDVRLVGNITDLKSMDKGDIVIDGCKNGITFEGIGEDATANGWGLRVKGSSNVEIRNLAYMNCDSDEGDDVGLQQDNDHVWVHNCDFFYGHAGSDADQKKGDGALDTKTSTYVTHSYNHFYDTGKSNLQGMKSETTSNYITYHHNWYDHADSRCPRIRTCTVHVYNNYYDGNSKYGIGATMGSSVFSENNYYRNCKYPMLMAGQGSDIKYAESSDGIFSGENGGVIKAYGNHIEGAKAAVTYQKDAAGFDFYEASSRDEVIDCSALKGGSKYSNFDTAADFYKYSVQSAEDAKDTVVKYAGRMNGGDFKWTFDNSVDDESYAVNEPLKAKLMSYKTTLVSVGGSVSGTDRPGTGETPGTGEDKPGTGEDKPGTGEDKPGTGEDKPSTGGDTDKGDKPGERVDNEVREQAPGFKDGDIYVSAKGSSEGDGSYEKPMDFVTALNTVKPGNTIWMFSATYYVYDMYKAPIIISEDNSGTADAYKTVSSINGKPVTINFDGMAEEGSNRGITLDGSYWHFYDIDICNAGDNGMLLSGDHNVIELCRFYANHDSGLQISRYNTSYNSIEQWPSYNTILNCTAYDNKDIKTCENADGFAAKLTCGEGNVFDGCISYCNSDDGWDLYAKPATGPIGVVTIKNCIAFGNGKLTDGSGSANGDMNGFKLGGSNGACPTPHVVENCLAFNNGATGFTDNGNGGAIKMSNCIAVNNGIYDKTKANFMCYRTSEDAEYTNIVSAAASKNAATDQFKGKLSHVLYNYKGVGTYWVNEWTCKDGAKTKYTGSEAKDYTVALSDFVNTTIPGYNASNGSYAADYHEVFRNADGSINVNQLYELKSDSRIYEAGVNGSKIGCSFEKVEIPAPEPTPDKQDEVKVLNRTLNVGMSGEDVKEVQQYLKNLGYLDSVVDGSYGNVTKAAAIMFQANESLYVDGEIGNASYKVMQQTSNKFSVLKKGMSGNAVKVMQTYLIKLGYLGGVADGGFGAVTEAAVKKFQSVNGLYADGEAGIKTLSVLYGASPKSNTNNTVKSLDRTLKVGCTGSDVKEVQQCLKNLGYLDSVVDGSYGNATKVAAMIFQANESLYVDGEIGNVSYKVMQQTTKKFTTLKKGISGNAVKVMQTYLIKLGYLGGVADGNFGAVTEAAVKKFQKDNGLYADGEAGIKTLSVLYKK